MPASYQIDVARRLVISRGVGYVTEAELLTHQRQLQHDPAFVPTFRQLWDCTAVTGGRVTAAGVRTLAAVTVFQPGTPRAIVVPGLLAYGLARMFQIWRSLHGERIAVFRELHAAQAWLEEVGVPTVHQEAR